MLFPKCGNISQPDQCFPPQHGATYHMSRSGSQKKKKKGGREAGGPSCVCGVTHTQEKHFQVPKCQWAITEGRLMHRGNMRAQGTDVKKREYICRGSETWYKRKSRKGARAWWSITIHSPLTFNSSSLALPSQNHIFIWNSQQPTIHHSATPLY